MNFKTFKNGYLLYLESHEEFFRELTKFCESNNIKNAKVSAIGAVNSVTFGFFNTQTKDYEERSFRMPFELTSLSGNVFMDNQERKIHVHATVADKDFRSYGGHLFRAIVSKTVEICITELTE